MEIEKLSRCTPLLDVLEWESGYVKVVQSKEITFTSNSDVNLTLRIVFSVDGKNEGHEHKFKLNNGWSSRSIRRSLPYCKVILTNETGQNNDVLILSVISDKKIVEEENETKHEEKYEERSKSPFKSILSRRRKSIPKSSDNKCRIPEHVPKGGLLCGDWDGKLKTIPPPIVGISDIQILTFQNNNFEWVILTEDDRKDGTISWKFD